MARPLKQGLEGFTLDVDFYESDTMKAVGTEFGFKGEAIVLRLLCAIYRGGYYALWDGAFKQGLLESLPSVSAELLETVVGRLVRWGFFDESLYLSDGVLTSRDIQERYFKATKRRKNRKGLPYLLVGHGDGRKRVAMVDEEEGGKPDASKAVKTEPEKEPPRITITDQPPPGTGDRRINDLARERSWNSELKGNDLFIENAAMRFHLPRQDVVRMLEEFRQENEAKDNGHPTLGEYRRHAFEWLRKRMEIKNDKLKRQENEFTRIDRSRRGGITFVSSQPDDYEGGF